MSNVYGLGDNDDNGKFTLMQSSSMSNDGGCQVLKNKLHSMTNISVDDNDNDTTNITKKAQDSLNVLNNYISECDR
jgi:hypothetical protein